jgi:serine/threonine protein kinase
MLRNLMQGRHRDASTGRNIIELFDAFDIESPNGIHRCLVLELAAPNLADLVQMENYSLEDRIYLFAQCVETAEYLHSLGISHGGTLAPSTAIRAKS